MRILYIPPCYGISISVEKFQMVKGPGSGLAMKKRNEEKQRSYMIS